MRVAIMQPTYLPWMGHFALMDSVDLFVILDSVQFSPRQDWVQRNRLKTANGIQWLTVPVERNFGQLITDVKINKESDSFPRHHIKAIELSYKRTPFFETYAHELFAILQHEHTHLCTLNETVSEWIQKTLQIETPLVRSSELNATGKKAELVANICKELGATEYITVPGAREYMEQSDSFQRRGIPVHYFSFEHPTYPQLWGEFVSHLSVIDLLFNTGPESLSILRNGVRASTS